ncbi:hypothetical protein VTN00DRAFT_863 [Thermoascus crustaceus]|uniref:uncharacterized protein n=1 Tax=Thermoascus crustaceus TaxID=5088 RepID=UPI00374480E2
MADNLPSAAGEEHVPKNAEDRKAAAALSSLNSNEISAPADDGSAGTTGKAPSAADQETLGKAMSRLEIAAAGGKAADAGRKAAEAQQRKEAEVGKKKAVKVAAEDVALLVEELDLNKNKATELLKAHDGDAIKAIKAFISVSA